MLPFQQVLNTNVMREEIYGDSVDKDMAAKECVPAHQSFEWKCDIFDNQSETSTDSEETDGDWSADEQPANTDPSQGDNLEHI